MIKRLDSLVSKESEYIHSPFSPEAIRSGDLVRAWIKKGDASRIECRVWRYSPFGIELIKSLNSELAKGDVVDITVQVGTANTDFIGRVVAKEFSEGDNRLVGIRLFEDVSAEHQSEERRKTARWACAETFLPTGTAPNPAKYNDFIFFRVEDISSSGMKLITSMRNKLIVKGSELIANISLPYVGSIAASLKVERIGTIEINEKQFLVLGTSLNSPDPIMMRTLSEYLLNFGRDVSAASLRAEGFGVAVARKWLDFAYAKTETDYKEVLALRFKAYSAAGKVAPGATPADMADEFDAKARILMAKFNGRLVGSMRLMFPDPGEPTDHGRYFESYPKELPPIEQCAETSRWCNDPEFKGTEVVYELLSHTVLLAIKGNRRYVFAGSAGSLMDFHKRCGWRLLNTSYKNMSLNGLEHRLMLLDTHEVAVGRNVRRKEWKKIYTGLSSYLIDHGLISPTRTDELRLRFYRMFGKS